MDKKTIAFLQNTHKKHYNKITEYFWEWVETNIQNVAYGLKIQDCAKDVPQIMNQWLKINKKKQKNCNISIKTLYNKKNEASTFWMPGYKINAKQKQSIPEYRLSLLIKWLLCTFCGRPSETASTMDDNNFRSCMDCGALACMDCAPLSPLQQEELQTAHRMFIYSSTFKCFGCKYHPVLKKRNAKVVYIHEYIFLFFNNLIFLYFQNNIFSI